MSNDAVPLIPSDDVEERLRELQIVLDDGIRYRLEQVFPQQTGGRSNRQIKRRAKLIRLVEPTLKRMLHKGEEVLYVATGAAIAFVLTNVRLLILRYSPFEKFGEQNWAVFYSEIEDFKANWIGDIKLTLRDKKKARFSGFPLLDRKSMPAIVQNRMEDFRRLEFSPTTSQSRESLCRNCFNVMPKGDFICNQCGTEYWTPRALAVRTLIFPAWVSISMKHYFTAGLELVNYFGIWFIVVFVFIPFANPLDTAIKVASIFLFNHAFFAMMIYLMSSDGLYHRRDPGLGRVAPAVEP